MSGASELIAIQGCSAERAADVIFVHGLDGHPLETWRQPGLFWPEVLAAEFNHVGVWSLGYPASKSEWTGSAMPLADRATNVLTLLAAHGIGERPLIFIVHSLGGLLVKQMMRHAEEFKQPAWLAISRATKGIAFLATPNSGSRLANWLSFWSTLRPSAAAKDLELNDSRLRELNIWFRTNLHTFGCRVLVFCEKLPMGPVIVVDESSADPGIPGVIPIPLDEDHASICKPKSKSALQLLTIHRFVRELLPAASGNAAPKRINEPQKAGYLANIGVWKPNEINALAWSPCSRYLAAASDDSSVRVWRENPSDLLLTIEAHADAVKSVCWSPDGKSLATCSVDGAVKVWSFPAGALECEWPGSDDWARSLGWADDGNTLICGYANGTVRIFSYRAKKEVRRLAAHEGRIRGIAIAPGAKWFATAATDGRIRIWDVRGGELISEIDIAGTVAPRERERAQVLCVACSPSPAAYIAAGLISGQFILIDTLTWKVIRAKRVCRDSILSLAWAPDGQEVVVGSSDRTVTHIDIADLVRRSLQQNLLDSLAFWSTPEKRKPSHLGSVRAVAWSSNGAIASGSTDQSIRTYSNDGFKELRPHLLQFRCAALSPDGRYLAAGSIGRHVMLTELSTGTHMWSYEGTSEVIVATSDGKEERIVERRREGLDEYIRCIAWSPEGACLVLGGDDRVVRVLRAETGLVDEPVLAEQHDEPIRCVAWSPIDNRIVSCSGSVVVIWNRDTGKVIRRRGHRGSVLAVAWEPSGRRFATSSDDHTIQVWTDGEPSFFAETPQEASLLSWSPDGKFILSAGPQSQVTVWDAAYGRRVTEFPAGGARTISWSKDGEFCAIGANTGKVILVKVQAWQVLDEMPSLPSTHRSLCLAFCDQPLAASTALTSELELRVTRLD